MQQGVDITKRVQEVVDVPDNNDYIDFEAVGICGVQSIAYSNINHFYCNYSKEYYI